VIDRPPPSTPALLELRGVTKHYAAPVLTDVDLDVRAGEVHALLGANGAGKSTLARIIAGITPPLSAEMALAGQTYAPANKAAAERAGVQIVQQELNLISTLTVAENLLLNRLPRKLGFITYGKLHAAARQALLRVGLDRLPLDAPAASLGVGQRQMVEIAAALDRDCRILILDEPTAALTAREIDQLFAQIRRLQSEGVGIIYISHRLDEIRAVAGRATVLRDGRVVATRNVADLDVAEMVRLMTGEEAAVAEYRSHATDAAALCVSGMTCGALVRDVSFTVHRGERLGVAGLVGSGRTELLRAIYGADVAESGSVTVGPAMGGGATGQRFRHPRQAVAAGLALVTEDRKQDGLLLSQSITLNTTLAAISQFRRGPGWLACGSERAESIRWADRMQTRRRSVDQPAWELSGGNQQKVVMARWLLRDADVLLLDEPTRGIDVGARGQIYRILDDLAAVGKAMVIVSSDLEELMEICDRIAVMSAGRLVATFDRDNWSRDRITAAAFHGYLGRQATADDVTLTPENPR
jgi:ribose transport system ATP-binding protein